MVTSDCWIPLFVVSYTPTQSACVTSGGIIVYSILTESANTSMCMQRMDSWGWVLEQL